MGKKLAIEHHLIRPNEVIELLEMMGGKNTDNADGCSFLYYTLCTPKINNPNNDKVICGFTNLKMQNDHFAIFTLEKFWKKYPYKVGDKVVYEDDNDIVVISEIMWDDTVGDIFYNVKRIDEDDCFLCPPELLKPYKDEVNMKDNEDKLFDSIIWHLRNSINNGKHDISGGDCERYFRELVDKVNETNMNEKKNGTAKEPLKPKSNAVKLVDGKVVDNLDEVKTVEKILAIKGHPTRGKEVIEILEMMGGCECGYSGGGTGFYYYISQFGNIEASCKPHEFGSYIVYTLEEFLEKYPFKVGDKVLGCYGDTLTIKSMKWSEDFETMVYDFKETEDVLCAEDMEAVNGTNEVFLKIEKNTNMNIEFDLTKYSYEVKDRKLVISEKKPKYPDNYEECVRIAKNIHGYDIHIDVPAYGELMESFVKLLICRDAYWKIAGEEMELNKPWEPKFGKFVLFDITFYFYQDNFVLHKGEYCSSNNCILVFPTEGMRDTFYNNFKELIEECKELL